MQGLLIDLSKVKLIFSGMTSHSTISIGGTHSDESLFGSNIQVIGRSRKCSSTIGHYTIGKLHLPGNQLIDLFEFYSIGFKLLCSNSNRLLSSGISGGLDDINSNIHHGSSSIFFFQSPLIWISYSEAKTSLKKFHLSESFISTQANGLS